MGVSGRLLWTPFGTPEFSSTTARSQEKWKWTVSHMNSLNSNQYHFSISFHLNSKFINFTVFIAIAGFRDLLLTVCYSNYVDIINQPLDLKFLNCSHTKLVLLFFEVYHLIVYVHPLFKLYQGLFKYVSECVTGVSEIDSDLVDKDDWGIIPRPLSDCASICGVSEKESMSGAMEGVGIIHTPL